MTEVDQVQVKKDQVNEETPSNEKQDKETTGK